MNAVEAYNLALDLMKEHGLLDRGWSFEFDKGRNRAGVCRYHKRVIGLSKFLLPFMKDEKVKDTILHEIAHALVGGGHGHDEVWRAKAIEIGCDGKRCYEPEKEFYNGAVADIAKQSKYSMECPGCGRIKPVHRRPRRNGACGKCCDKHNGGRYDHRFKLILTQNY